MVDQAPKTDLELIAERDRQALIYIRKGFHTALGMSPEQYLASLPEITPLPSDVAKRFPLPLIVDARISAQRQLELADIENISTLPLPKKESKDKEPYVVWVQDGGGAGYIGQATCDTTRYCDNDETPAGIIEGIALVLTHPDVIYDHNLDIPGNARAINIRSESQYLAMYGRNNLPSGRHVYLADGLMKNCSSLFGTVTCLK